MMCTLMWKYKEKSFYAKFGILLWNGTDPEIDVLFGADVSLVDQRNIFESATGETLPKKRKGWKRNFKPFGNRKPVELVKQMDELCYDCPQHIPATGTSVPYEASTIPQADGRPSAQDYHLSPDSYMGSRLQASKSSTEPIFQNRKESSGQHSANVNAITQCDIIPTDVYQYLPNADSTSAGSVGCYESSCTGSLSSRPGEERAQGGGYSSPQLSSTEYYGPSLPLLRFINSTSSSNMVDEAGGSRHSQTAIIDEQTARSSGTSLRGAGQGEFDDETRVNCQTLDISTIPSAAEYWTWDDIVKNHYHRDEDTQSLVWYESID